MASLNKFLGIGNLTKDPDIRYLSNGEAVASITIACNETWRDKSGAKQEKTEFIRVTFYRKLAEIAGEYLKKGRPVYIEGRLETRKWTDKNGIERYTTDIIATDLKMLGQKSSNGAAESAAENSKPSNVHKLPGGFEAMDDDIPF